MACARGRRLTRRDDDSYWTGSPSDEMTILHIPPSCYHPRWWQPFQGWNMSRKCGNSILDGYLDTRHHSPFCRNPGPYLRMLGTFLYRVLLETFDLMMLIPGICTVVPAPRITSHHLMLPRDAWPNGHHRTHIRTRQHRATKQGTTSIRQCPFDSSLRPSIVLPAA